MYIYILNVLLYILTNTSSDNENQGPSYRYFIMHNKKEANNLLYFLFNCEKHQGYNIIKVDNYRKSIYLNIKRLGLILKLIRGRKGLFGGLLEELVILEINKNSSLKSSLKMLLEWLLNLPI